MLKKFGLLMLCYMSLFSLHGEVKKVTQAELQELIIKSDKPLIIDFYADWCQPCKLMAPVFERVAEELKEIISAVKANFEECKDLVQQHKVTSLPTCIIIKGGNVVGRTVGLMDDKQLKEKIDEVLHGPKDLSKLTLEQLQGKLLDAIMQQDIEGVKQLIKAGVDVNKKFSNGYTPLFLAVSLSPQLGSKDLKNIIGLLLDAGGQVGAEGLSESIDITAFVQSMITACKKYEQELEELETYLQEYRNQLLRKEHHENKESKTDDQETLQT